MNNDKIIKDLKERNDKLANLYRLRDIRCVHLEMANEKLQQENNQLKEKQKIIDRAISFMHILKNNLKDYTKYEEYTKIFNEMLNDILEILGGKENE